MIAVLTRGNRLAEMPSESGIMALAQVWNHREERATRLGDASSHTSGDSAALAGITQF